MDRDGHALGVLGEPGLFTRQAISPDGRQVAVVVKPSNARETIWIYDVDRGTRVALDADETGPTLYSPRWSPDGKQVAFRNTQGKTTGLYIRASDGSGKERQIGDRSDGVITSEDWSPDGKYLAITHVKSLQEHRTGTTHCKCCVFLGKGKPQFEIDNAADGKFSPDGHWLAYHDDASGQVYVTAFPGPGARIAVSSGWGLTPLARRRAGAFLCRRRPEPHLRPSPRVADGTSHDFFSPVVPNSSSEQRRIL